MPHIVVECSAGTVADPEHLLEQLVAELSNCESVSPSTVKARLYEARHNLTGRGAPKEFAHLEVRILAGRPVEVRQRIADQMANRFCKALGSGFGSRDILVTAELREMDPATYRR